MEKNWGIKTFIQPKIPLFFSSCGKTSSTAQAVTSMSICSECDRSVKIWFKKQRYNNPALYVHAQSPNYASARKGIRCSASPHGDSRVMWHLIHSPFTSDGCVKPFRSIVCPFCYSTQDPVLMLSRLVRTQTLWNCGRVLDVHSLTLSYY